MYLTDLSTGGTIYAWGGGTVAVNPASTLPVPTQLQWNLQVGVTQMPIPLQQNPLLLNFGGAEPSISIEWVITSTNNYTGTAQGDWTQLMNNVAWGSSIQGYALYLPEVSTVGATISVQGFTFALSLTYVGGTKDKYDASLTFYQGTVI